MAAEITGEAGTSSTPPPPPITEVATNSTKQPPFRSTKPGTKRLLLTVYVLLSFLLGLPFLLHSTEIHRSPLPSSAIADLSRHLQSHPPSIPCRFQAVFLSSGDHHHLSAGRIETSISAELHRRAAALSSCGGDITVSATVDYADRCVSTSGAAEAGRNAVSWPCGAVDADAFSGEDEVVDELLNAVLGDARVYTVVVVDVEEGMRVVVGKHRHAWIVGRIDEAGVVPVIGTIFGKYFVNAGADDGDAGIGKGEFMPVGSDGNVVFSFSLLNADPGNWVYDW